MVQQEKQSKTGWTIYDNNSVSGLTVAVNTLQASY